MDIAVGASLSMAMQGAQVRHRIALEMVRQQHQQMQAVADMIAAATAMSALPGRGETVDILV